MAEIDLAAMDGRVEFTYHEWEFTQGEDEESHEWMVETLEQKLADEYNFDDVSVMGYTLEPHPSESIDSSGRAKAAQTLVVEARVMSK
jgi:hypothetical protein